MASPSTVAAPKDQHRLRRELLRRGAADLSRAEWLKRCGNVSVRPTGAVGIRGGSGNAAGFAGLETCGSWSACPCCSSKIGAARADDLAAVIAWAHNQGHTVALLSLTGKHNRSERLRLVWDRVGGAWNHMSHSWASETVNGYTKRLSEWNARRELWTEQQGRALYLGEKKLRRPRASIAPRRVRFAESAGLLGWARAVETTDGKNGWHTHLHVVVVFETARLLEWAETDTVRAALAAAEDFMFEGWSAGLKKHGGTAVRRSRKDGQAVGADLRVLTAARGEKFIADYLTKTTDAVTADATALAREAVLGGFKSGKAESRTPFELLSDALSQGLKRDVDRWREWVDTARGRKQLTWSQGLRELAGMLEAERTDEEIAAEEVGDPDLLVLTAPSWRTVRADVHLRCRILAAVDRGGRDALEKVLDLERLEWITPEEHARDVVMHRMLARPHN